jgi:hypothetical protein
MCCGHLKRLGAVLHLVVAGNLQLLLFRHEGRGEAEGGQDRNQFLHALMRAWYARKVSDLSSGSNTPIRGKFSNRDLNSPAKGTGMKRAATGNIRIWITAK